MSFLTFFLVSWGMYAQLRLYCRATRTCRNTPLKAARQWIHLYTYEYSLRFRGTAVTDMMTKYLVFGVVLRSGSLRFLLSLSSYFLLNTFNLGITKV